MKKTAARIFASLCLLAAPWLVVSSVWALGEPAYIGTSASDGSLQLAGNGSVTHILLDPADHKGVAHAVQDLREDFFRVSGIRPDILQKVGHSAAPVIIVGTVGHSAWIDRLDQAGKIDLEGIRGRWEAYHTELVDHPLEGVPRALVIAGSDMRGTIFGIYDLSEQIGVSPWYWWADVPPRRSDDLFVKAGTRLQDAPAVKYRGIFLNDEAPALTGWVHENFGDFNHEFYLHVFELLLRLKSNFLWPAMWNNAFADDDPMSMVLADEYGIVMSTSHHEPMMRADKEWDRHGTGPWDYARNPANLFRFWTDGARRNKPYESIYTIGMRGQQDTPMSETEDIELLERIVADQRTILADVFDDRPLDAVPQVWALYKEVQGYYESGMRVPDDVILLWCDDNWGNIRRLPTPGERTRAGGAGVYYHFDYVGGPRSYRWMNVTQLARVWEQMNLAYRYDANQIWLTNVGDLKPMEYPVEFFLDLAWDIEDWPRERIADYPALWAARNFGAGPAAQIGEFLEAYTRHNSRRTPELQDAETYSLLHYREAERIEAELMDLTHRSQAIFEGLDEAYRSAYFQLVHYPLKASATITQMYIAQARNHLFAGQGRASTNHWARRTQALFSRNRELQDRYHGEATAGKWNHMMSQPRIGYVHWHNPPADIMPAVMFNQPGEVAYMGVAVEGMEAAWPAEHHEYALAPFYRQGQVNRYIEVFNKGNVPFEYTVEASEPWIRLEHGGGFLESDERIHVSIDWDLHPGGKASGRVFVKGAARGAAVIAVTAHDPAVDGESGFIEADGYVSMEAANFSRKQEARGHAWQVIPGLGREGDSVAVFPVGDISFEDSAEAPWLEYDLTLFSAGEIVVQTLWAPTWPMVPGRGLRFAIAIDDEPPRVIDLHADRAHALWQESVRTGVRPATTKHDVATPGHHKLRIYMVDPATVLQKIVIDTGGLQPSYLGPVQSRHAGETSRYSSNTGTQE